MTLEKVVDQIMAEHLDRKDLCQEIPLKRRGYKRRPTPKTAIIAHAAQAAIEVREWLEQPETEVTP